ncbi:protein BatD [bacterium]|nr:protein BatD [candidate division CSSED10-310 bacterium]
MRKIGSLIILMWIAGSGSIHADPDPVELKAFVEKPTVYLFDRFVYQLDITGPIRSLPEPQIRFPEGLSLEGPPRTSSQVQWINGSWSSRMTYQYHLKAAREGAWTIPPATAAYQGETLRSRPVQVTVVKMQAGAADERNAPDIPRTGLDDVFIWASVDLAEPYVGQAVTVTYELFTRLPVVDYQVQQPPAYSGFWAEEIPIPKNPQVTTRKIQGIEYAVAAIHRVELYPTVTGELLIDPLRMILTIEDKARDPFDSMFTPFGSRFRSPLLNFKRQESRSAQSLSIQVKPLPGEGRPADFTGAVGKFEMKTGLDKNRINVGEAVVMKVELAGNHILATLPPPRLPDLPGFKVYEPKSEDISAFPARPGWESRTFETVLVPHRTGDYTLPPLQYSYFDPDPGEYRILKTQPISLHVEPAPGMDHGTAQITGADGSLQVLGHEIRYIKTGTDIHPYKPAYLQPWVFMLTGLPVPALPLIFWYGRHRRKMMGDIAYARAFRAKGESQEHFKSARTALQKGDARQALDEIFRGFASYIGNRINLPATGLTLGSMLDEFDRRNVPRDIMDAVKTFWQDLETARFAPGEPGMEQVENLLAGGQTWIGRLEKLKLKPVKTAIGRCGSK